MIIAGIGSRATPPHILDEMHVIGATVAARGGWVRSGHADGADYAFEKGAGDRCIVYLPWKDFNWQLPMLGLPRVVEKTAARDRVVDKHHLRPHRLTGKTRLLMIRNVCQICGEDSPKMSDFVVCWTPGGALTGGTSFAIRLANHFEIPVMNMATSQFDTSEKVLSELPLS